MILGNKRKKIREYTTLRTDCQNTCFSGPHFPEIGLNTENYWDSLNLRIQFKYGKIRTRKTSYLDNFHAVQVSTVF